jgi:hypothetical protein
MSAIRTLAAGIIVAAFIAGPAAAVAAADTPWTGPAPASTDDTPWTIADQHWGADDTPWTVADFLWG